VCCAVLRRCTQRRVALRHLSSSYSQLTSSYLLHMTWAWTSSCLGMTSKQQQLHWLSVVGAIFQSLAGQEGPNRGLSKQNMLTCGLCFFFCSAKAMPHARWR
jgi:hypothetical protein